MKTLFFNLFCLLFISSISAQETSLSINNAIKENKVLVVSHRADWRNAPENSLQAIKNCIEMGVDMVEIDLKKTKDGVLVLMHDKTIDRTMTGKGKPSDYTISELKKMNLKNGCGHKTSHTIPTFEEVMLLCKDKILVNVDKGYDYFDDVYKILKSTCTVDQCIIKASLPFAKVKNENPVALSKMFFMPVVKLQDKTASQTIEEYTKNMNVCAFELVFDKSDKKTCKLIEKISNTGSKIFINSLWPELCGGHDDDRAVEKDDKDGSWGWIINNKATFIQTDRPAILLQYLKNRNLHK